MNSIRSKLKGRYVPFLIWTGILLFVTSVVVYQTGDEMTFRLLRPSIGIIYLAMLLMFHQRRTHPLMTAFLLLFIISSVLGIWYEENWVASACMMINALSYLVLVAGIWPKIHFKKLGRTVGIGLITVSVIMGALLYQFMGMIEPHALSDVHYYCTWTNAVALYILGILVFVYNHEYNTRASLSFIFFVVFMIFAEVFRGIGYYEFAFTEFALYIEKALMIVSLSLLIQYSFIEPSDKEPLSLFRYK